MKFERFSNSLNQTLQMQWDYLLDYGIATDKEIETLTKQHGWSIQLLQTILYLKTGYQTFSEHIESHTPQAIDKPLKDYSY
jgi:hypothetical protein